MNKAKPQSTPASPEEGIIEFDFDSQKQDLRKKFDAPSDSESAVDPARKQSFSNSGTRADNPRISFSSKEKMFSQQKSSLEKPSTHSTPMPTLSPNITPSINDFRRNAERQKREQESVSSFLSIVVYSLLGGVLLIGLFAGFGGYSMWKRINDQAVTVSQLDSKYGQQVDDLKLQLEQAKKTITEQSAQNQQQQEKINKLASQNEKLSGALRDERSNRARETADLQKRIQRLENRKTTLIE